MSGSEWNSPENLQALVRMMFWAAGALGALWLVTSVLSYFHRRAYNLTRAESGPSKNIKPDFLTVDHAKRSAAIARGEAYEQTLTAREAAAAGGAPPAAALGMWARMGALTAATLSLLTLIVGTLTKIDSLQAGAAEFSSWDRFSQLVSQNKVGTVIAIAIIGANVIVFVQQSKKTIAGK